METKTNKPDGGPAFACAGDAYTGNDSQEGMSLRDYFAAHAPEVPEWWPEEKYAYTSRPSHGYVGEKLEAFKGWGDYLDDDQINPFWLEEFKEFAAKREMIEKKNENAAAAAKMDRLASWRMAYADAMLKARGQ